MEVLDIREQARLEVQDRVDRTKTAAERNRLGQFATPTTLATDVLEYARELLTPDMGVRFLDPAFGTGSFYSALLRTFPQERITSATGYEVDALYGEAAGRVWKDTPLSIEIEDFTRAQPPRPEVEKTNLLICNPPYVRHHHLSRQGKERLARSAERASGVRLSGLAGLYCHFLLISHAWMSKGGLAGWLIPSEFMDVGYGKRVKEYLLNCVTLLRVHRFDPEDAQFADALVSSAVVWFRNAPPPTSHEVEFTYGGTLLRPKTAGLISAETLRCSTKWTGFPRESRRQIVPTGAKLSDLFEIKRGMATGANEFFVLAPEAVAEHGLPSEFLRPILPSPRYLTTDEVEGDANGEPILERKRFLLACDLPEEAVRTSYPLLWRYLQKGAEDGINERYLCRHRRPWYSQEKRPPSPLLCTYMNRRGVENGRIFRFVLNRSKATAHNVYLMLYPKPSLREALEKHPDLLQRVWMALNEIPPETLLGEGRVYGGGLHKIEPKELGNASAKEVIGTIPKSLVEGLRSDPLTLFAS